MADSRIGGGLYVENVCADARNGRVCIGFQKGGGQTTKRSSVLDICAVHRARRSSYPEVAMYAAAGSLDVTLDSCVRAESGDKRKLSTDDVGDYYCSIFHVYGKADETLYTSSARSYVTTSSCVGY